MQCLSCQSALEYAPGEMYARCLSCFDLFMNMSGTLTPYPVDDSTRSMMEMALGFKPSKEEKFEAPSQCPQCQGHLEQLNLEGSITTRCDRCGLLSRLEGKFLMPVIVQAPNGGWDPEFQAIFEENLGFSRKVFRNPPGVVG